MSDIDLTPAEALVLLDPDLKQGRNAFKVSMMWLLAQRHLVAETVKRSVWRGGPITRLATGPRDGEPLPADLEAVMRAVRDSRTGIMQDVVKAAAHRFGANLLEYQNKILSPALRDRDLIHRVDEKSYIFFTSKRWRHTPRGRALAQRIEGMFEDARRIPEYLDRSPAQAAALAASLGGLILLVPELRPHLNTIAAAMRDEAYVGNSGNSVSSGGDAGTSSSGGGGSGQHRFDDPSVRETSSSDNLDVDFDFPDIDFAEFTAVDASFDSAAGAGGSDGGGGDGGGGGGG